MWYAYVLRSLKNQRLYIGCTNDLQRRLAEHNRGKNRYARYAGPFQLVYSESYPERLEARRRELFLKTGKGREFLKRALKEVAGG